MIRYTPSGQLSIEEFSTPFQAHLDKENRWVKLVSIIPWDRLASIYYQSMSADQGAPSIDARIVIGAMIIKHKLKLDDREVVETIRENMYLQYFLGLSSYTAEPLFDWSLFTAFRYRLGQDKFDQMIKYPTDLDLLSDSRRQSGRLIDQLCELLKLSPKS